MARPRREPNIKEHVTTKGREIRGEQTAKREQRTAGVKPVPKANGHANDNGD